MGADAGAAARAPAPAQQQLSRLVSGVPHALKDHHAAQGALQPSQLEDVARLGEGAFATVAKAWYNPADGGARCLVAVKRPKPALYSSTEQRDMWRAEIGLMRQLKHSCIVAFIGAGGRAEAAGGDAGACDDIDSAFCVQELMEGGSLKGLVTRQMMQNPTPLYSDAAAVDICLQIARGLRYLHSAQPMVIHRDLKLENIMLASKDPSPAGLWTAKIADLGLSTTVACRRVAKLQRLLSPGKARWRAAAGAVNAARALGARTSSVPDVTDAAASFSGRSAKSEALWATRLQRLGSMAVRRSDADPAARVADAVAAAAGSDERYALTTETGSLMYMSPEVYLGEPYNEKADVFSFAMVMYEVLHRYMTLSAICIKGTPEELEQYAGSVARGYRPPILDKWAPELRGIIEACWAQDPGARPSMHEVVSRLEGVVQAGQLSSYSNQAGGCCAIC